MKWVKNKYGTKVNYDVAITEMDEEIMNILCNAIAPCTEQEFFSAYCKAHEGKYGKPFELDKENPCY